METTNTPTTVENVTRIEYHGQLVLTTAQLADFYETTINNLQVNFRNNSERFVEGKHYFKLEGDDLENLRLKNFQMQISSMTRTLYLWTKRGAARHAKMLNTDRAWDVFELLEDSYFDRSADREFKKLENDRLFIEQRRLALENDDFSLDMKNFFLKQDRFELEREKIYFERQRLDLDYKELAVRRDELAVRRERTNLEQKKLAANRERLETHDKKLKQSPRDDDSPTLEVEPKNEELIRRALKDLFDKIFSSASIKNQFQSL